MKSIKRFFGLATIIVGFAFIFSSCEDLSQFLTQDDTAAGLKEALRVSTDTSVGQTNKFDGFYGNTLIKIAFPQQGELVSSVLTSIGGTALLEPIVVKINRAAEEASAEARPIFKNAITSITFTDALGILKGNDTSAMHYMRTKTQGQLHAAFKPKIETALTNVGAQSAYSSFVNLYNPVAALVPGSKQLNPDLADYTTGAALNGLFKLLGEEERKIRQDPVHRVTEILQKVFGK